MIEDNHAMSALPHAAWLAGIADVLVCVLERAAAEKNADIA